MEPSMTETELCLQDVLKARAESGKGSIICYPSGNTSSPSQFSYLQLYTQAGHYSQILRALPGFAEGHPVLLHLDDHWDAIVWFWAVLLAHGLPVMSSPFSFVEEHRHQHIRGLSTLLQSPICITRNKSLDLFDGSQSLLQLHTIERLCRDGSQSDRTELQESSDGHNVAPEHQTSCFILRRDRSLAALMLTSGSTGNAKAVRLNHKQIITSVSGKSSLRPSHIKSPLLNWIGLDHVAGLVEIHFQALWLDVDQVHVNAADVVSSPKTFLDLLSRHRVCRTFAPNFFLGRLVSTMRSEHALGKNDEAWDLSNLQTVVSGGEANDIDTCVAAAALFQKHGANDNVIMPGFGMTETCAGAIYNLACPDYDIECDRSVACLGTCLYGIEMRVVVDSRLAAANEPGNLELRGDIVFDGYYRNTEATNDAFPAQDGWFRTGDWACIDPRGNLCLVGRTKEIININGVKYVTADIHSLLERALCDKIARFVVFPSRAAHTEQITIGYVPKVWPHTVSEMAEIDQLATQACITSASTRPLIFALLDSSLPLLPLSTLGKISRAKMRSLFESGAFKEDVALHKYNLDVYRRKSQESVLSLSLATKTETLLIDIFSKSLDISPDTIGPDAQVFELGFTSMNLIRLKSRIETCFEVSVPMITLMRNPTARLLGQVLDFELRPKASLHQAETRIEDYNPVVSLRSHGSKTPLWLIHPGVGEVLVFIGLAQQLADDDRPIYALRARGFELGHTQFSSLDEIISTYTQAIRERQPQGPYALVGYSYGAMLAFETAKRLNYNRSETIESPVRFLASLNLPPHIKSRMRELSWNVCLIHLAQFLGLMTEKDVEDLEHQPMFSVKSRSNALAQVTQVMDVDRFKELGLEDAALVRWTDVAFGLQNIGVEYDPTGQVDGIDVFHAVPLRRVAASREQWLRDHLGKWRDFSRTEPRFHEVGGAHYTMIGPEYVTEFAVKFRSALAARGI